MTDMVYPMWHRLENRDSMLTLYHWGVGLIE